MTPYNVFNAMHAVWSVAMIPLFVNAVIIIKRTKTAPDENLSAQTKKG